MDTSHCNTLNTLCTASIFLLFYLLNCISAFFHYPNIKKSEKKLEQINHTLDTCNNKLLALEPTFQEAKRPYENKITRLNHQIENIYERLFDEINSDDRLDEAYRISHRSSILENPSKDIFLVKKSIVNYLFEFCESGKYISLDDFYSAYRHECYECKWADQDHQAEIRRRETQERLREEQEREELLHPHKKEKSLLEQFYDDNRRSAYDQGNLFGENERVEGDDGYYLENNYGTNGVGFGGSRVKIVEESIDDSWVRDEYGRIHIKDTFFDED